MSFPNQNERVRESVPESPVVVPLSVAAAPQLAFRLGPSLSAAAVFVVVGAAALAGTWAIIALPAWARVAISAAIVWRTGAAVFSHGLRRGKSAVCAVKFSPPEATTEATALAGALSARRNDGRELRCLARAMFFSAPVVVLSAREVFAGGKWRRFRWRRRTVILAPADCMDAESHRRFRIRCRRAFAASMEVLYGENPEDIPTANAGAGLSSWFLRPLAAMLRERGERREK